MSDTFMPWLHDQIERTARASGIEDDQARSCAAAVDAAVRETWGGSSVYLPGRHQIDRDRLRAEFNGRNYTELARRYACTERHVRELLRTRR